ncbi:phage tail tube protein [Streptomyces sp. NPDC057651]|uniref:phage tail tube protein n=1 Tax=Streptomyces sp. NPDC057651 TaxID=3346194 RepID=UPI003674E3BC
MPDVAAETVTTLARRFRLEVDMSNTTTPSWAVVPGVQEFAPKIEPTDQDSTTYGSDGWAENTRTMLAWSVETTITHRAHPTTGAWNAAQEKLRAASKTFGAPSYVHVRWYDRDGKAGDNYEGSALVTWEPDGGNSEDLDTISVTLTGSGPAVEIPNPAGS